MISLINIVCKVLPFCFTPIRKNCLALYKLFYHFKQFHIYRPITWFIPCTTLSKPEVTSTIQYDVEENIAHLMTLARIALEKGDIEKAEAILEMGIKISDEYQSYVAMPYMYDILASISFARGNLRKAEILLVNIIEKLIQLGALENDSQIIDFKLRLARIYSAYDEKELAEIGFKTCLINQESKIAKGDVTSKTGVLYVNILFWYGLHKLKNGNYIRAKKLINSAYNYSMKIKGLTPYQEMIIMYTLSDVNMQLQNYDIALQNIQSAIILGKGIGSIDLPKFYLRFAKIYMRAGSKDKAKHWLHEAQNLADIFNDKEVFDEAERIITEFI